MTKHTPGPWILHMGFDETYTISDTGGCEIGHIYCESMGDGEHEANARLIAAAPELLEAAKAVAKWLGRDIDDWDSLRTAIAKAESTP